MSGGADLADGGSEDDTVLPYGRSGTVESPSVRAGKAMTEGGIEPESWPTTFQYQHKLFPLFLASIVLFESVQVPMVPVVGWVEIG